jgi:CarD family transcriptional regulator
MKTTAQSKSGKASRPAAKAAKPASRAAKPVAKAKQVATAKRSAPKPAKAKAPPKAAVSKAAPPKSAPAKMAAAKAVAAKAPAPKKAAAPAKAAPAPKPPAPKAAAKPAAVPTPKPAEAKPAPPAASVKAPPLKAVAPVSEARPVAPVPAPKPAEAVAARPIPRPAAPQPRPAQAVAAKLPPTVPPRSSAAPRAVEPEIDDEGDEPAPPPPPPKPKGPPVEFKAGDHVVYPTHGVGQVQGIEEMPVAGMSLKVIIVTFEENRMTLRVPVNKAASSGLRKLASGEQMQEALEVLRGRARIKRTMWSRRAQEYEAKINSGDPIAIAEVVRDLHRNAGQPDQSFSERQIYEQALDRLAAELAAIDRTDKAAASEKLQTFLKAA